MAGNLINDYNTVVLANTQVRDLLRAVVQDAQTETQDDVQSCKVILDMLKTRKELLGEPRRIIIGWLTQCACTQLSDKFWFEMHTRMGKLLLVSAILEGANLRSFGVEAAHESDVPTAIGNLYRDLVVYRRERLPGDRVTYAALFHDPGMKPILQAYLCPYNT